MSLVTGIVGAIGVASMLYLFYILLGGGERR